MSTIGYVLENLENVSSRRSQTDHVLILDLDETLVHCETEISDYKKLGIPTDPRLTRLHSRTFILEMVDIFDKPGTGSVNTMWGVKRPHLDRFLMFCFSYFKIVGIWSAGQRKYVEAVCDRIFNGIDDPHIVFTREKCDEIRGNINKPLSRMMESHPVLSEYMRPDNTFVLDDLSVTFSQNPLNGINIPRYEPPINVAAMSNDDPSLCQLMQWFHSDEVKNSKDVRTLDKSTIFTTPLREYINPSVKN